jgi:prepilin-type N-terminal cleavage/methylation domain-containing protein
MDSLLSVSNEDNVDFGCATAAPANSPLQSGFTMLELMVVIVIIGILASLAYSSLVDMIFTNRAKETAQAMRTFAERSLMEAKRQSLEVELSLEGGNMVAKFKDGEGKYVETKPLMQPLSDGFSKQTSCPETSLKDVENKAATSEQVIGLSGIKEACFSACGGRDYCGAVVKKGNNNFFEAQIKKGSKAQWRVI